MTGRELLDIWRLRVMDIGRPYLWGDTEFLEYLNEAQLEAARRAHLLVDSTSPITEIDISTNDSLIELDQRIIFIRRARLASRSAPLQRASTRDMDEAVPGWENTTASAPTLFIPDYQTDAVRIWPPTNRDDTMKLTIVREPLDALTSLEDELELAPRYHRPLLHWCSHRAYLKPDTDTLNPKASAAALTMFEAEFGPPSAAINEHWNREQNYDNGDFQ